ncbi:MAG: methyltransferase domain-containing protein [Verrucomicrobiales bacterium]
MIRIPFPLTAAFFAAFFLWVSPGRAQSTPSQPLPDHYTQQEPTRDGTGKIYMGREISQVVGHTAVTWLERPEREREEKPDLVIENMELKPTDVAVDVGAGSGYFSFRMAPKVPQGKVIAEDIQQPMLDFISERSKQLGVKNVETLLGTVEDTKLAENSVDVVLLVDAYHEFSHPREMMLSIFKGLKSGGRLIQLEYRGEDKFVPIKPLHKMTEKQVILEQSSVGFKHVETRSFLPSQHFLVFVKP